MLDLRISKEEMCVESACVTLRAAVESWKDETLKPSGQDDFSLNFVQEDGILPF